jgi:DNA-binding transcriptional regulator PaaX
MKKDTQNIELEDEEKNSETIKEKIENFFYSDSVPATAAKFTLAILALGTVAFVGAAVPGLIALAEKPRYHRSYSKKQMRDAVYQLKKKKLIEIILEGDITKVRLTNKGADRVKEFCLEFLEIKKPKKWDKKWRVLIFDIPSKPKIYNLAREALRKKIKDLGFQQLQKSVWIYPYECEDEILFVAEIYQVQKFIEILTVEKLLHENILRTKFKI